MSEEALQRESRSTTTTIIPDDAPRVTVQPSLNRDFAAIMALLFVVIMYHIQHPTLLFEAQFGRGFRGDSLQDGIAIGLVISALFLIGSPRRLWNAAQTERLSRLQLALAVVIVLYMIHAIVAVIFDFNIFYEIYGTNVEFLEDTFREDALLIPIKVLGASALLGGAAAASMLFLWSPWNAPSVQRHIAGVVGLVTVVLTYHIQSPLLESRSWIAIQSDGGQIVVALILAGAFLALAVESGGQRAAHDNTSDSRLSGVSIALLIVLGAYVLHVLAAVFADYNIFLKIFDVNPTVYDELLAPPWLNAPLLALDRAMLFSGFTLAAVLMLWSPWEKLPLYGKVIRGNLAPIVVAIIALALWEGVVELGNIKEFLLPRPSVIGSQLAESYPAMLAGGWFTFLNAFKGFVVGCALGVITGIFSARYTRFSTAILPLAIAANSVPIIAFAPIANFWFGVTSPNSNVAIVAVLCYFPAMISTVRGLTTVDATQLELMRSYAATEVDIFRRLRFPNALPLMFSAFKLATTLSMIGAIVAEFFGGSLAGLGYRIREDAALFRFPESWSAIIVASLFGISFYLLISAFERAAMPWYQSFRSET